MSTLEDLEDLEREQKEDNQDAGKDKKANEDGDVEMAAEDTDPVYDEVFNLSTVDIQTRKRLLENDSRIMKSEYQRLTHEKATMGEKIKDNNEKIENNRCALEL